MISNLSSKERLNAVDALRGFALLAIVVLHNLEHYNIYFTPEYLPEWLKSVDRWVWDGLFFLFAGKAYATFSLLFGFSFYIQYRNAEQRGIDFRGRFAWRMLGLVLFSQLHALFYNGDILLLYAVVGLVLIPVARLKDKTVFWIALLLQLQPYEWGRMLYAWMNPEYVLSAGSYVTYSTMSIEATIHGSFWEVLRTNIWAGQMYSNLWQIGAGRLFQTAALFMFGMLLGRGGYFIKSEVNRLFWKRTLRISAVAFVPLHLLRVCVPKLIENPAMQEPYNIAIPSLTNFAFMAVLVSGFMLLWFRKGDGYGWQRFIIPFGRMSLTNYITQSIMGGFIYYGYGLVLYRLTGTTATVAIGLAIGGVLLLFSRYWLSHHKQGPLEYLWKRWTWMGKP